MTMLHQLVQQHRQIKEFGHRYCGSRLDRVSSPEILFNQMVNNAQLPFATPSFHSPSHSNPPSISNHCWEDTQNRWRPTFIRNLTLKRSVRSIRCIAFRLYEASGGTEWKILPAWRNTRRRVSFLWFAIKLKRTRATSCHGPDI